MGLLEKTREVTDAGASKAAQLKDAAANKATDLRDQAATKLGDVIEGTFAKLKETLADFDAALPILKSAGYTVGDVSVELGLPPRIVASFLAEGTLSAEQIDEMTAANADKKLAVVLLKTLFQARRLQDGVTIRGLKPKGLSVEVGLLPTVVLKFA